MTIKQATIIEQTSPDVYVKVVDGQDPEIGDNQILIKAVAFAANPCDYKHRGGDFGVYGAIAGHDASGTVAAVGKNVTGFVVGDQVSTFLRGNLELDRGAWAEYVIGEPLETINYKHTLTDDALATGNSNSGKINTFEGAASLTLSMVTVGVSFADSIKISYDKQENANKYILIWGGATAAGVLAIQAAKIIYGLKVITTSSKKNFDFLRSLGADKVFDYHDAHVVEDIKKASDGRIAYALDTVAHPETFQQVYDASADSEKVSFDNLLFLGPDSIKTDPSKNREFGRTCAYFADGTDHLMGGKIWPCPEGLVDKYKVFWEKLHTVLDQFQTTNLVVLKPGLESANEAMSLLSSDRISAQKVVWRLN